MTPLSALPTSTAPNARASAGGRGDGAAFAALLGGAAPRQTTAGGGSGLPVGAVAVSSGLVPVSTIAAAANSAGAKFEAEHGLITGEAGPSVGGVLIASTATPVGSTQVEVHPDLASETMSVATAALNDHPDLASTAMPVVTIVAGVQPDLASPPAPTLAAMPIAAADQTPAPRPSPDAEARLSAARSAAVLIGGPPSSLFPQASVMDEGDAAATVKQTAAPVAPSSAPAMPTKGRAPASASPRPTRQRAGERSAEAKASASPASSELALMGHANGTAAHTSDHPDRHRSDDQDTKDDRRTEGDAISVANVSAGITPAALPIPLANSRSPGVVEAPAPSTGTTMPPVAASPSSLPDAVGSATPSGNVRVAGASGTSSVSSTPADKADRPAPDVVAPTRPGPDAVAVQPTRTPDQAVAAIAGTATTTSPAAPDPVIGSGAYLSTIPGPERATAASPSGILPADARLIAAVDAIPEPVAQQAAATIRTVASRTTRTAPTSAAASEATGTTGTTGTTLAPGQASDRSPLTSDLVAQTAAPAPGATALVEAGHVEPPADQPAPLIAPNPRVDISPALTAAALAAQPAPPEHLQLNASGAAGRVFAAALRAAGPERADTAAPSQANASPAPLTAALLAAQPAAPVTAAAHAPGVDLTHPGWPAHMVDRIEALRDAADATSTRVRISPDALGPVDLQVRREGDQVHVHFAAQNADTRALLADAQPQLAQAAADRGLRLGQTSVGAGGSGLGSGSGSSGGDAPRPSAPSRPPRASDTTAADDVAADDIRIA